MKKKLLVVILFCLSVAGTTLAWEGPGPFIGSPVWRPEVINVDLNIDADANAYGGKAAYDTENAEYDDDSLWHVFYPNMTVPGPNCTPGWGIPIGSHRSANLSCADDPNNPAIYAAQVWIGENSLNGIGYRNPDTNYPSPGLMNDGLRKSPPEGSDPNIRLWGVDAYKGTFDIYVYGSEDGNYTLSQFVPSLSIEPNNVDTNIIPDDPNTYKIINTGSWNSTTKSLTGSFDPLNANSYVVFTNVFIDDTVQECNTFDGNDYANTVRVTDGNSHQAYISYTNVINGLQLVSKKAPVVLKKTGTVIEPAFYDVAGEKSGQASRETNPRFGPSLVRPGDANWPEIQIAMVDRREFMVYDINVENEHKGRYVITMDVTPYTDGDAIMNLFVDDVNIGVQTRGSGSGPGPAAPPIEVNLFPGIHTIAWMHTGKAGSSTGYNILDVNISAAADANLVLSNCAGVAKYNLIYEGDLNDDCRVDRKDLDIFSDLWLECDDPNWRNCP